MSTIILFICCVVVSFLVWFVFGMVLLSPQGILSIEPFGPPMIPISTIAIAASVVGIVQGSLLSILILRYKPKTVILDCFFSFIATEIFLLPAMLIILILFFKSSQAVFNFSNLIDSLIFYVFYYLVLSLIFLIPSLIIGFTTGKVLNIANSKMLM